MAVNEEIVTGRKFRKLVDEATKLWQRISFWTKASDVEFDDGNTAEDKMGAISGITSDVNGESENIAASIKVVNELNNKLPEFIYDSDGKITGYKTSAGADTVFPFSSGISEINFTLNGHLYDWSSGTVKDYTFNHAVVLSVENGQITATSGGGEFTVSSTTSRAHINLINLTCS